MSDAEHLDLLEARADVAAFRARVAALETERDTKDADAREWMAEAMRLAGELADAKATLARGVELLEKDEETEKALRARVADLEAENRMWRDQNEKQAAILVANGRAAEAFRKASELEAACWKAIGYPPGEDDAGHVETLAQAVAGLVDERDHLIDERARLQYQIDGDKEIRIAEVMGRAALLRAIGPFVRAFRTERYGNGVSGHHWKTLFDAATEYETGKAPK